VEDYTMNFRAKFPLDGLIMVLHAHDADFLQGLLKKKLKKNNPEL
jgi:hypothetical protein